MEYFTLAAAPNTNLWRKPPDRETSTAPIVFTSLRHPFVIAEVTVSADWEMEWDQGGLVIFAGPAPVPRSPAGSARPPSSGTHSNASQNHIRHNNNRDVRPSPAPHQPSQQQSRFSSPAPSKWVKAGLEFSEGTVNASSVSATADGADWCLSPLALPNVPTAITSLRIKLERIGHSLWIWYQLPSVSPYAYTPGAVGNSWRKLREVTWFFWEVEDKNVHVGVYASRPANFTMSSTVWGTRHGQTGGSSGTADTEGDGGGGVGDGLVVEFEDLEIF
jgi:regulation of enolase protein 1 (concanavalin A-like superfamily)